MAAPTDQEQYLLELINEARLDPLKNAARYITSYTPLTSSDPDIQAAIDAFNVSGSALLADYQNLTAVDPLAWNSNLADAAENHSAAMIAADEQSYQVLGEDNLGDRYQAAGYTGFNRLGENVQAYADSLIYGHAGFMIAWGNGADGMQTFTSDRNNIMWGDLTEVGINVTTESSSSTDVGPLVITEDFGNRGLLYVLGVAYTDSDADDFYSIGEGRGDLTVSVSGSSTTTAASGGYALAVAPGDRTITFNGGGLSGSAQVTTKIEFDSIKLDIVDGNTLLTSGSVEVSGAISVIRAIGKVTFGLTLTAGEGNQDIYGYTGRDTLNGGGGNDRLFGGDNRDTLNGGSGDDELEGGEGNDTLNGGLGTDAAVYDGNHDDYTVSSPSAGNFTVSGPGIGTDTLTSIELFRFADGEYIWNQNSEQLVVNEPNEDPDVDSSQSVSTSEDTAKQITVSATDPDGDTLTYSAGPAGHGSVTGGSGGVFTYTPDMGFEGSDSFVVTVNDGNGGSATQTVNVTVTPENTVPTVAASQDISTDEDTAAQFNVAGEDADGDTLTYSAGPASHGTVSGGAGGTFTYTPAADYNGADSFVVTVNDGKGGTAQQTVNVTVDPLNDTPIAAAAQAITTSTGNAKPVFVTASDADGDTLEYSAGSAENGTVSGGSGGVFTYTPGESFSGSDSFTVMIDDGNGASIAQAISVTVTETEETASTLRFFATDGFVGKIGGSGTVFGSNAFQDITVGEQPDDFTFDASFNRGGDIIRFLHNASAYSIALSGSSAVIDDGTSSYTIPIGSAGISLVFADGVRSLRFDESDSQVKIGGQVVDEVFALINTPDDGSPLPTGAVVTADARVFLSEGAEVTTGGNQSVFGTLAAEHVYYMYGDLILDPSYNKGGDTLHVTNPASHYTVYLSGSQAILMSDEGTITIPVGTVGMTLDFDGDQRLLRFDTSSGQVKIGDSVVSAIDPDDALPVGVSGSDGPGSLDQGSHASSVAIDLEADTAYVLTDNANQVSNVVINGFDDDDRILVTGIESSEYNFSSVGDDIRITYSDGGAIYNEIILLDVANSPPPIVSDLESAVANVGWNFIDFA
ncbi:MAG: tandem-95 repeat protein [Novosphingobium sp.]